MAGSKLRDELRHTLETCLKETREGGMLVEGLEPGVPHGAVALGDDILVRDGRVLQRCLQLLHPDDANKSAFSAVCGTWTVICPAAYQAPEEMKEALKQHAQDALHETKVRELWEESPHRQAALLAQVVCVQEHIDLLVGASRHVRE